MLCDRAAGCPKLLRHGNESHFLLDDVAVYGGERHLLLGDMAASALAQWRGLPPGLGHGLAYAAPLIAGVLLITLIALVYRFLPAARVDWRDAWRGALLTAILIEVGRAAIGVYLRFSSIPNLYDAAGALVLLLFWLYYSALVFLFGAEVTWALGLRRSMVPARSRTSRRPRTDPPDSSDDAGRA